VKNDRTLLEVNLHTLAEREVYRVSDDWVGYGTWVANSDCTKLVGIEIAKSDWTPLNDWKIFHDFFHKGPHCRLLRVDLKTGESSTIHEEKTGWGTLSIVRSTTTPSPSVMKGRTTWWMPACGWSTKMAATCVK
jgi:oligogalacturonide lyase